MRDCKQYIHRIESLFSGRLSALSLRIFLGAAIGFALASPAVPARAQADLGVSGAGATTWTIGGIMPGDSGTKTLTLSNIGDVDGQVFIWVTNIVSGEGAQPESETGNTSEPGELLENLLFSISSPSPAFSTDLTLPTTLDNFPSIGESTPYITVNPLIAGGADVEVTWYWDLPLATGNEVQGDCITFDIHYGIIDLEEPPTPTTTSAGTTRTCECHISILEETYEVRIDCCNNTVTGTRVYLDPDEIHFLEIERGTVLICGDCLECGNYPRWIVMSPLDDPPPPPEGMIQIGPAYRLIGYSDEDMENECTSVVFGKPVVLLLNYDPDELPGDTSAVVIAYFDEELGEWVELLGASGRVAGLGDVTAVLNHLSTFGVFAKQGSPTAPDEPTPHPSTVTPPSPPSPAAHFVLSNLNIVPERQLTALGRFFTFVARSGESITITANVANQGGQQGSYKARLQIDGNIVSTKDVALPPGQSQQLVFTILDNAPGPHTVQVGELQGKFWTSVWINWWLIAGLAAAFVLLVWGIWYLLYRRRRGV